MSGILAFAPQGPAEEFELALRRERLELARARYYAAAEGERRAAIRVFEEIRSAANPEGEELDLRSIDLVLRALVEGQVDPESPEQELADVLSLRVVPGAFEARTDGPGEATTVHLSRARDVALEGDQILSLYWLGPLGEEVRARREVIPEALMLSGSVEMFIRTPAAEPGTWQLLCEVGMGERARRGRPVNVDCVKDLAARRSALSPLPEVPMQMWTPGRALDELCEAGIRHPVAGALALLKLAEEGVIGRARASLERGSIELHITPTAEPKGTLVLAGGSALSPIELGAGAASAAWLEFAESEGLRLILLDLPLSAKAGVPSLPMRIIELRKERPVDEFHLVAFGDVAGFVPSMRARYPELALDSVTLVSDSVKRGGRDARLDVRTMLVECSGESPDSTWSLEDDFGQVHIPEPFVFSGALVPELMIAWDRAQ